MSLDAAARRNLRPAATSALDFEGPVSPPK
jgi:hypothetical protein